MFDWLSEANTAALIGLLGGIVLGLAARVGRFCTLGAVEDFLYGEDDRRLRMWGVAIGVAVFSAHLALAAGAFDPTTSIYLSRGWSPVATVLGGLMFGYGMALSGTCGHGALARLGGGDLRAFVMVLIMGLSAYVVLSGPLAATRIWLFPVEDNVATPQGLGYLIENAIQMPPALTGLVVGTMILAIALSSRDMRQDRSKVFWGAMVGLAITSGWVGTHWIATTGFGNEPVETHAFVAPVGDTIYYAMTASGNTLSFSVGSVVGVIVGASIASVRQGHFRWEACEDPRELRRQMLGAALMGPGAVLALGCSIGQGLSAFSTLALSAPLALLAIFAGAGLGLRQLITGLLTKD
ncbi:MAG: YeeE/YedE family protein [Pseudomonadota bacterium]